MSQVVYPQSVTENPNALCRLCRDSSGTVTGAAIEGVGSLLPLERVPSWQTLQWQKAPDTVARPSVRILLLRSRRGGPINVPQNSGPHARDRMRLDRENSMVLHAAERFWAIEFCVFVGRLKSRKIGKTRVDLTRSATDAEPTDGRRREADELPKSGRIRSYTISLSGQFQLRSWKLKAGGEPREGARVAKKAKDEREGDRGFRCWRG